MNGFTNAILSLLLGWVRSFFNVVWAMLNSNGGGSFLAFLRANWKVVFLVLCVGGFVVDRVIYFIRWRPYYVWGSRRRYRRERRRSQSDETRAYGEGRYAPPPEARPETDTDTYARPASDPMEGATVRYRPAGGAPGFAPAYRYQAPAAGAYASDFRGEPQETRTYEAPPPDAVSAGAPTANAYAPYPPDASFAPTVAYGAAYRAPVAAEPLAVDPCFDDDPAPWGETKAGYQSYAPLVRPESAAASAPAFDAPLSGQDRYLKDVQAGFAPPITPEALYAPRTGASGEPVHPGLDMKAFQQNLGLDGVEARSAGPRDPREAYADFAPFPETAQPGDPAARPRVLGTIARKARTFVSGEDESNPPSIRDLQPTVDVTNAFRAPVYPKKRQEGGEES